MHYTIIVIQVLFGVWQLLTYAQRRAASAAPVPEPEIIPDPVPEPSKPGIKPVMSPEEMELTVAQRVMDVKYPPGYTTADAVKTAMCAVLVKECTAPAIEALLNWQGIDNVRKKAEYVLEKDCMNDPATVVENGLTLYAS